MLKILSSKSLVDLETEANKLNIEQVGSLSISNGHYFLVLTIKEPEVKPKVEPKIPEVKPKDTEVKPKDTEVKPKAKRSPAKKKSPSKPKET